MKMEKHLEREREIKSSINSLEMEEKNTSAIVELVYGCALHYIAFGSEKKFELIRISIQDSSDSFERWMKMKLLIYFPNWKL